MADPTYSRDQIALRLADEFEGEAKQRFQECDKLREGPGYHATRGEGLAYRDAGARIRRMAEIAR